MPSYGFSEADARRFLERELRRHEASTSFYWESEEMEELLELIVGAVTKLLAANNDKLMRDYAADLARRLR
jgi:hypothetical protein